MELFHTYTQLYSHLSPSPSLSLSPSNKESLTNTATANQALDKVNHLMNIPIDFHDTNNQWWTSMSSHDNEYDVQERIREFVTFARYCDADIPIFVGHSLFFKAFYSKRISNELYSNRRYLSDNLKKFRLSNASLLAVTVSFVDVEHGLSDAILLDADVIFGGGFNAHHSQGVKASEMASLASQSLKTGHQHLRSVATNLATNITNSLPPKFTEEMKQKKQAFSKGVKLFSEKVQGFFDK